MRKANMETFPESESAKEMLSYVTEGFYEHSYVGKWLYEVMGRELDALRVYAEELSEQPFPETATWGLRYLEEKFGLPVRENLAYEERRKQIYQKRDFRAPMTPYRMEIILAGLTGRTVTVQDSVENKELPPNTFSVSIHPGETIVDFREAYHTLDDIKQSHTTYELGMEAEGQQEIFAAMAVGVSPIWEIRDEGLHQVRQNVYAGIVLQPTGTIVIEL